MSFRTRLTLFFVMIVIVPMVSVGVVVFGLIQDNETGKADARVSEGQNAARAVYQEFVGRAAEALRRVGNDPALLAEMRARNPAAARARASVLLGSLRLRRLVVTVDGRPFVDVGSRRAIAPASSDVIARSGTRVGRLQASVLKADNYAAQVRRLTGLETVVRAGRTSLAGTLPGVGDRRLPSVGDVSVRDREYRAATFQARSFAGPPVRVSVLSDAEETSSAISRGRLVAAAVLAGFLLLAFAFAIAVSRSLQSQIERLLQGARRLAGGDFSTAVPTDGNDEFAALGEEFNKMSRELERRLEELGKERARLEESIRRIGQTFASNLDSEALLEIVVGTAVDALGATGGRSSLREADGQFHQRAVAGRLDGFEAVIQAVEASALESGQPEEGAVGDRRALAVPLAHGDDPDTVRGLVSAAREGLPFTPAERDLFAYLARQSAVSLENVSLHQVVQQQAVTDELTGLSNHRRFQDVLASEVERAKRFDQGLGLVMLDVDDFKAVNDTYGHQQGDLVLREVARALKASSREIDEPARYGGEELAVALPQTDLDGAYNLAERVRTAIEELEIPRLDGAGFLSITASLGAAALPDCAEGKEDLIRVADEALYEAKRAGKNRTERARATAARTVRAE